MRILASVILALSILLTNATAQQPAPSVTVLDSAYFSAPGVLLYQVDVSPEKNAVPTYLAQGVPAATMYGANDAPPTVQAPVPAPVPAPKPQKSGGGVIDIGQAFSDVLAPYINAIIQAFILALVGWMCQRITQRTGVQIDAGHREAITKALENQAGSLIADGEAKFDGATVSVPSAAMGKAVNDLLTSIPAAAKHFGLTPDYVAKRIIDTIPQIAAGAQMIAAKEMPKQTVIVAPVATPVPSAADKAKAV